MIVTTGVVREGMMSRSGIEALLDCARTLGLFVLLEAFDEADLEQMHDIIGAHSRSGADTRVTSATAGRAAAAPAHQHETPAALLAGLNCRDLTTLQIVPTRLLELAHLLPSNVPRVAESGVTSAADAARVAEAGYEYALVGSALMQGGDPRALASAMLEAGRGAKAGTREGAGRNIKRGPT